MDFWCKIWIIYFKELQIYYFLTKQIQDSNLIEQIPLNFRESSLILIFAILGGLLVRYLYFRFSNSFSSKSSYGNTLLMVTISVASLIAVVKSSLALSLGLVGALSVVRFRTAVKEPYTLSFILFSVGLGIAIGANQYRFAFLVSVVGTLITYFISNRSVYYKGGNPSNNEIDTLTILASDSQSIIKALELSSSNVNTYSIKTISSSTNSNCSATIGVNIESNEKLNSLICELTNQPGILNVTFYNSPV